MKYALNNRLVSKIGTAEFDRRFREFIDYCDYLLNKDVNYFALTYKDCNVYKIALIHVLDFVEIAGNNPDIFRVHDNDHSFRLVELRKTEKIINKGIFLLVRKLSRDTIAETPVRPSWQEVERLTAQALDGYNIGGLKSAYCDIVTKNDKIKIECKANGALFWKTDYSERNLAEYLANWGN